MSLIYDYLKEKVNSFETMSQTYYIDLMSRGMHHKKYLFCDFFKDVNKKIEFFKNKFDFKNDRVCFLIVNNNYQDIVSFIALLEMGIKTVIINEKSLYDFYTDNMYLVNSSKELSSNFKVIMPYEIMFDRDKMKETIIIDITPDVYDADGNYIEPRIYEANQERINRIMNAYLDNNKTILETLMKDDYSFALPTSGTTGESTVVKIKESDLIKKLRNHYDLNEKQTYLGFTPISSISGLIFSVYLPIIGRNINIAEGYSPDKYDLTFLNDITMILPGNYFAPDYIVSPEENQIPKLQFLSRYPIEQLKKIIFLGDKIDYRAIEAIQKETLFSHNKINISNAFGRTENLGIISEISNNDIKPIYIYYEAIKNNKIIYSFDKKNVIEATLIENRIFIEKSDVIYNEKSFCEVLPIAVIGNPKEDVKIKNGVFNEIIAEGKNTGDYGFQLDNKIYFLCRGNELIKNEDTYLYLTPFERIIREKMNEKVLISRYKKHIVNQKCYCIINEKNHINIYIPCRVNYASSHNFSRYYEFYKDFKDIIPDSITIDKIYLIDRSFIPHGREIGKLKRKRLLEFNMIEEFNLINPLDFDFRKIMEKRLKCKNFVYQDGYFIFAKHDFSVNGILNIARSNEVIDFHEDNDNYYVVFSDKFLFAKRDEDRKYEQDKKNEYYDSYDKYDTTPLRKFILRGNGILKKYKYLVRVFYNEKNELSLLFGEFNSKYKEESIYEFEKVIETSTYYESYYGDQYYNIIYSIDNDNNLYLNSKYIDSKKYSGTIIDDMYDLLLSLKKDKRVKRLIKN